MKLTRHVLGTSETRNFPRRTSLDVAAFSGYGKELAIEGRRSRASRFVAAQDSIKENRKST
jgi:hypothetical protein